ncbi:hypothetical protein EIP86_002395 [Pleurotus ostreatoroseus]|nr:hypothetical protein EIP86_002395 [Pleurotus ostreatoroseus]
MSDAPLSDFEEPPHRLESQIFPPALRKRFGPIVENPLLFAQTVRSQLAVYNNLEETCGPLGDLFVFLAVTSFKWHREPSCRAAKNTFIKEGLLDKLLEIVITGKVFWMYDEYSDICPTSVSNLADTLLLVAYLTQFGVISGDESARKHISLLAVREKRRISQFLHDVWCHRDKTFDNSVLERSLQDELTDAILVFILEMEALYHNQDHWIRLEDEWDSFERFFEIVMNGLELPETQDPWCKALKSFLADARHAEAIVDKCTRCLLIPNTPGTLGLSDVLQFIQYFIAVCPSGNLFTTYRSWLSLLHGVARACERDLCQSVDAEEILGCNQRIIPRGIEIFQ